MPRRLERISADEARLAGLRAQGLLRPPSKRAHGVPALLRELGAVQLDTISVLARSHELVPYARLGAVGRGAVEAAYWSGHAFEYFAHAACVLPIEMWPYFAFRRRAMHHRLYHMPALRTVEEVRTRLREAPATASDVGGARTGTGGWWSWSDAKRALEALYMRGELVCTTRRGWKRLYDTPERALPASLLAEEFSDAECYNRLVQLGGRALGVATRRDIADYYRLATRAFGIPPDAKQLLTEALDASGLVPVEVDGWDESAFADPAALRPARGEVHRTTLLSPFDSLIWERKRTARVFGFALSLEAYKPRGQRIHGYFAMPLLSGGKLVGRVDPAREGRTLIARTATLHDAADAGAMAEALVEAASWVGCDAVRIEQVTPRSAAPALRRAVKAALVG